MPWGSGADRWRLTAGCASAAVLAAFVFPLAAHWIWAGGWLAQLGVELRAGRGISRCRRRGHGPCARRAERAGRGLDRRTAQGQISQGGPFHRHARPQRRLCALRLPAGAGGLAGLERRRRDPLAARAARRAARSPRSIRCSRRLGALVATFAVTRFRFGKPDASLCANGWLAGLVASSACAATGHAGRGAFRRPRRRHRHAAAGRVA